jgi:iron complex outermembrane recepter protein
MTTISGATGAPATRNTHWLVQAAVATAIASSFSIPAMAADTAPGASELQEVTVTGSRIVRRDTETTSPLMTVDKEVLEKSAFISIEQSLNELPQFMAGGALFGAGAVTGLTAAGDVAGSAGTGNMFDTARPVDNARVGQYTPGAAILNLRGLGVNRSLTLIDGRRAVPSNASGAIDLNTIPQIAISSIEVITGGASSVYGADALAGVTNIKLRDNFDGLQVRARGGINEAGGDGQEWQMSTLMGLNVGDKGHAMVAMDYSKRQVAYWENRDFFRDAMVSPLSASGDYIFGWYPGYTPGTAPCNAATCVVTSLAATAGGGSNNVFNNVWAGNGPTQTAINAVFADRTCATSNCVTNALGGYLFNGDGTLFTRSSAVGATQYGAQSFTGILGGTKEHPDEVTCGYAAGITNTVPGFQTNCVPTLNRVDYGRRLTSPHEGFTLLGSADYDISEHVNAYTVINFATSETETRREPAPTSGAFVVSIPYASDPNTKYLPSIAQVPTLGVNVGDTLPEFRTGGKRGTNCAPTGGCTMQQAFPVTPELRTLLNSRPNVTLNNAASPFNGQTVCELRTVDSNAGNAGHTVQVPASGTTPAYTVQMDPNTGETYKICGPNSAWRLQNQMGYLPPRGTLNNQTTYQVTAGLKGDLGVSDWTWDTFITAGESRTLTEYVGYISAVNYAAIMSAPNYGQGYTARSLGVSNKVLTCTSGLNPYLQAVGGLVPSQDCIDAITSNQSDRQSMRQYESQLNLQGKLAELPAGDLRSAVGFSWRKNDYSFTPDSLRESDYISDTSAGQFGVGHVDGDVSVKEYYAELLIPLLKDLPAVRSLELELGGRYSLYSTGQDVPTYKAQLSWEPLQWMRVRGGYNRAERTPNIAELYTTPTVSSQLSGTGSDPCGTTVSAILPGKSNAPDNPNRAQLQALCSAQINAYGGNNASAFHANPNGFVGAGGVLTFAGNPNLESEKGDTWTAGVVLQSPFENPLAHRMTATIDWYSIKISNPIDVLSGQNLLNACFNVDGSNPTYSLNDPTGSCKRIVRDPVSAIDTTINSAYANIGKLSTEGVDVTISWAAPFSDMGMEKVPGTLSLAVNANYLIDMSQPVTVGGDLQNYAGYVGASKYQTNTTLGYTWDNNRVSVNWLWHNGTQGLAANNRPTTLNAGYPSGNLFNLSAGTRMGPVDVSLNINNVANAKPDPAGYPYADAYNGFGTYDPYADLVGRRYSLNLTMNF